MSEQAQPNSIYEPVQIGTAIRQGEIITGLIQYKLKLDSGGKEFFAVTHDYSVVVSQDCDLDWDFKARIGRAKPGKLMPSILFCEVVTAAQLRAGEEINSEKWNSIKNNKDERYQFLQGVLPEQDILSIGLPELGVDFKRYFTIPTEEVYEHTQEGSATKRRCRLKSPYVEHLNSRFCYYQSRIALPSDHFSEPKA